MFRRALVPLDGTEFSEAALPHADWLAHKGVKLTLVRVVPTTDQVPAARQYLEQKAEPLRGHGDSVATAVIESPDPGLALAEFAEQNGIDLIVMATHSRSGLMRMLEAGTADKIMNATTIPILLVRPLHEVERPRLRVFRSGAPS